MVKWLKCFRRFRVQKGARTFRKWFRSLPKYLWPFRVRKGAGNLEAVPKWHFQDETLEAPEPLCGSRLNSVSNSQRNMSRHIQTHPITVNSHWGSRFPTTVYLSLPSTTSAVTSSPSMASILADIATAVTCLQSATYWRWWTGTFPNPMHILCCFSKADKYSTVCEGGCRKFYWQLLLAHWWMRKMGRYLLPYMWWLSCSVAGIETAIRTETLKSSIFTGT